MTKIKISLLATMITLSSLISGIAAAKKGGEHHAPQGANKAAIKADREAIKEDKSSLSQDNRQFGKDSPQANADREKLATDRAKLQQDIRSPRSDTQETSGAAKHNHAKRHAKSAGKHHRNHKKVG